MDKKIQFVEALTRYLQHAKMFPLFEEESLTETGEYRHLCFMKTYYKEGDETPYRFLVPTSAWLEFLERIDQIFASRVNGKLAHRAIDQVICELAAFPFNDDTLEEYSNAVFEILLRHFELQIEALVPLYNIRCEGVFEMPLANTVLHSGHSGSLLANKISHLDIGRDLSELRDNCFLCIQVTGDNESRLAQVELETEQALKVLRFITMWHSTTKGNKRKKVNPANFVTARKTEARQILYHRPDVPTSRPGLHSDIENPLNLGKQGVELAQQYLGLDDLNYHYQNIENPISDRVRRALELYDSGTRALTNWQALYRYVASINVALPTSSSRGNELEKHLETIIKYGGHYVGTMKKDDTLSDPDTTTWDEMVKKTAEPFTQFYMLRGKILHGNPMSEDELSDTDVEDARVLAHNGVRLLAKLAREFQWENYKEAKNWFNSPSYPPSIELPNN